MLLVVIILSGTILAATAIAGLLTLQGLRQAANAGESVRALYAADTGIEWGLYRNFKNASSTKPVLSNGAEFEVVAGVGVIRSTGFSNDKRSVARAFEAGF